MTAYCNIARVSINKSSSLPPRENTDGVFRTPPARGGGRGGSEYPISVLEQIIGCQGGISTGQSEYIVLLVALSVYVTLRVRVTRRKRRQSDEHTSAKAESGRLPHREVTDGLLRPPPFRATCFCLTPLSFLSLLPPLLHSPKAKLRKTPGSFTGGCFTGSASR